MHVCVCVHICVCYEAKKNKLEIKYKNTIKFRRSRNSVKYVSVSMCLSTMENSKTGFVYK